MEPKPDNDKDNRFDELNPLGELNFATLPKLDLFSESLSQSELALLYRFTQLTACDLVNQLKQQDISNNEVARRIGKETNTPISRIGRGDNQAGEKLLRQIQEIALQAKEPSEDRQSAPTEVAKLLESADVRQKDLFFLEAFNEFSAKQLLEYLKNSDNGLSLRELASTLGISKSQISYILSGDRVPSDELARVIRKFAIRKALHQ